MHAILVTTSRNDTARVSTGRRCEATITACPPRHSSETATFVASMASARMPIPSVGLLRFLRCQSENQAFFSPNHAPSRKILCSSRRQPGVAAQPPCEATTQLQSGLLNLEQLLPSRAPRSLSRLPRTKRSTTISSALAVRYKSSSDGSCRPTLRERLWGPRARKVPGELKPDDLPEHDEDGDNSMFMTGRQRAQQAALEPRLRCTEVDENGNAILVDGEFKKTELIARVRNDAFSWTGEWLTCVSLGFNPVICERSIRPTCLISSCGSGQSC